MSMVKKSISVTGRQDKWIKSQIAKGFYGNDSEVIRELIRERQMREQETPAAIEAIRRKLEVAERSGFTNQSADTILAEIKTDLGLHGGLQTQ